MRRLLLFVFAITASLLVSSCLIVEQEITLKRNGSGIKTVQIDLGEMISNPMMAMMSGDEGIPSEKKDSSWLMIDDLREHNPQWTSEEIALLENARGEMSLDTDEGVMLITMSTTFNSLDELKRIERLIADANKPDEDDEEEGAGGMPDFSDFGNTGDDTEYEFTKKSLSLMTPVSEISEGVFGGLGLDEEDEGMEMLLGMLDGSKAVYKFNLPGKVKKVKGMEGAVIDGNTVTVEVGLMEAIEDPEMSAAALTGEIKFK
ncbi:hypothetical protein [Lewinella sp. 4G2]|uniref:hypothetical protein n=1 Tax=Lewinella sp. 4G2 TaxID=1803372 RepID=UPI0007B4C765|nr:hypothetical protein [Lewinella sp. 4G2]OAV45677.1 hypothetical protein A3850_014780 [Lewinella sp. 4G2]